MNNAREVIGRFSSILKDEKLNILRENKDLLSWFVFLNISIAIENENEKKEHMTEDDTISTEVQSLINILLTVLRDKKFKWDSRHTHIAQKPFSPKRSINLGTY